MALGKANSVHPVALMRTDAVVEPAKAPQKAPSKPSTPAVKPKPDVGGASKPRTRSRSVKAVTDTPVTPTVDLSGLRLPSLPERRPVAVEAVARRAGVTLRGKREVSLLFPVAELDVMLDAYRASRTRYRKTMLRLDPGGKYQLSRAAFLGAALEYGLDHPGQWIGTVRNDARFDVEQKAPSKQIGLRWPESLIERFDESWDLLDMKVAWPEGFRLTKSNLASAAIRWAILDVDLWLGDVPNDDRFSEPVEGDRRLRPEPVAR